MYYLLYFLLFNNSIALIMHIVKHETNIEICLCACKTHACRTQGVSSFPSEVWVFSNAAIGKYSVRVACRYFLSAATRTHNKIQLDASTEN